MGSEMCIRDRARCNDCTLDGINLTSVSVAGQTGGSTIGIGGLVGVGECARLSKVNGDITVAAEGRNVGGFYGQLKRAHISKSSATVDIDVVGGGHESIGGLLGAADDVTFSDVTVDGDVDGIRAVGGVAGTLGVRLNMEKVSCAVNVTATDEQAGGLVGHVAVEVDSALISRSFSTGSVLSLIHI